LADVDRYPHYQYSYVRTDIATRAFVGSPLKRPLTLLTETYILSYLSLAKQQTPAAGS